MLRVQSHILSRNMVTTSLQTFATLSDSSAFDVNWLCNHAIKKRMTERLPQERERTRTGKVSTCGPHAGSIPRSTRNECAPTQNVCEQRTRMTSRHCFAALSPTASDSSATSVRTPAGDGMAVPSIFRTSDRSNKEYHVI